MKIVLFVNKAKLSCALFVVCCLEVRGRQKWRRGFTGEEDRQQLESEIIAKCCRTISTLWEAFPV